MDYRLYDLDKLKCWPAGTGYALADWLRTRGHEPVFLPKKKMQSGAVGWACRARIDDHGNTQRNRHPGLELPFAHSQSQKALAEMASGQLLKVLATDVGSVRDFQAFAKQTGNELVEQQTVGEEFIHVLRRR